MRRILAWFPDASADEAAAAVRRDVGAATTIMVDARTPDSRDASLLIVEAPNQAVERVVEVLSGVEGAHLSLLPTGVLSMAPPADQPPDHLTDVTPRSPIEVFLGGVQSVGSWRGFLSYAAVAGGVVWLGLYTNTVYLLTAAMLIAPFAGPAMNAALATARGDGSLLRRSCGRYAASLAVTAAVAAVMSVLFGVDSITDQMTAAASLTYGALALPLLAGAAGAVNLVQSERSSLVSGAATGMLVAAALAPPAGLLGIAVAVGSVALAEASLFQLGVQLVAINGAGALVFLLTGIRPRGVRFAAGRPAVRAAAFTASALLFAGFVAWQVTAGPSLTRATVTRQALSVVEDEVGDLGEGVGLLDVQARFVPGEGLAAEQLLVLVHIAGNVEARNSAEVEQGLESSLERALARSFPDTVPFVDVTVLTRRTS